MIDTSVMVASLVRDHQFHELARPHVRAQTTVPAIVLAETYAQLRRTYGQSAAAASHLMRPWTSDEHRIGATSAKVVRDVFVRSIEMNLGGSIHDALIAATCGALGLPLVTLDRRQHALALAFGADSNLLLPS